MPALAASATGGVTTREKVTGRQWGDVVNEGRGGKMKEP
jgi:hypothetical protein